VICRCTSLAHSVRTCLTVVNRQLDAEADEGHSRQPRGDFPRDGMAFGPALIAERCHFWLQPLDIDAGCYYNGYKRKTMTKLINVSLLCFYSY